MKHSHVHQGWRGHLFLGTGWLLYSGPIAPTALHAHHALQVLLESESLLELSSAEDSLTVRHAVIPADRPHAFRSPATRATILYLAPESRAGRSLSGRAATFGSIREWQIAGDAFAGIVDGLVESWAMARSVVDHTIERIGATQPVRAWPPAVERFIAMLPAHLESKAQLSVFADRVGLSASRLSHLVTEHVGIPFRVYVLWLRLQSATKTLATGRPLTEAAHAAGFADSAHLSRVFRRMFGIAPSEVTRFATWHVAPASDAI